MILLREGVAARLPLSPPGWRGLEAIVKAFLALSGLKDNLTDGEGCTLLLRAAEGGHEVLVKLLLIQSDAEANSKDVHGRTLLRVGRASVAIRRFVYHSWYEPAGERPRWAGTNWKGSAGQGPAIRTRPALDRKGFSYVYKY